MIVEIIIIISIFVGLHYLLMNRKEESSKESKKSQAIRTIFSTCPKGQYWAQYPDDFSDMGECVPVGKYFVNSIGGHRFLTGTEKGGLCANDETCISRNCVGNYSGFAVGKCA